VVGDALLDVALDGEDELEEEVEEDEDEGEVEEHLEVPVHRAQLYCAKRSWGQAHPSRRTGSSERGALPADMLSV
jgi:hypothetical protein